MLGKKRDYAAYRACVMGISIRTSFVKCGGLFFLFYYDKRLYGSANEL